MKFKQSILLSTLSLLLGFIPLTFSKEHSIEYRIYASSILQANRIKDELMDFYQQKCVDSSFKKIDHNIQIYQSELIYKMTYNEYIIEIKEEEKICLTGVLYEKETFIIEKKFFFH